MLGARPGTVCGLAIASFFALAGCAAPGLDTPDTVLHGVRTDTSVSDDFRCGGLLFAQGCVIVRVPRVDSGCAPEVGGYVVCNATVEWTAESGAVVPGSRLDVTAGDAEPTGCDPDPGDPCRVTGVLNHTHHFGGPGEEDAWRFVIDAGLTAPGDLAAATGHFTLTVEMAVRTEGVSEAMS